MSVESSKNQKKKKKLHSCEYEFLKREIILQAY